MTHLKPNATLYINATLYSNVHIVPLEVPTPPAECMYRQVHATSFPVNILHITCLSSCIQWLQEATPFHTTPLCHRAPLSVIGIRLPLQADTVYIATLNPTQYSNGSGHNYVYMQTLWQYESLVCSVRCLCTRLFIHIYLHNSVHKLLCVFNIAQELDI